MHAIDVDARAICECADVGPGTKVRAFGQILEGARVGADCLIHSGVLIDSGAVIGDRVTVNCNVHVHGHVTIEHDATIGSNVSFARPPARPADAPASAPHRVTVGRGASIGGGATVMPGVTIGHGAIVGAGTVISRSVPPFAVAEGNPARITGYVDSLESSQPVADIPASRAACKIAVRGVTLHELPVVHDLRGDLAVCEFGSHMPFTPHRYFVVFNVPSTESRGAHAHRQCAQLLVAMHGSLSVVVDDGTHRQQFLLDSPSVGLHIPPMVWGIQYRYSTDTVLLVLASHAYSSDDYIRDYAQYQTEIAMAGLK
jgi:UDP-2-acetamido-3-amino-2,3-dideoxy-glucuronate N-acetyltransferase